VRRAGAGEAFKDDIIASAGGGQQRVYSVSGTPVRDGAGELAGTVIVVDDITERTEAERTLRRMLDQTRYLVENTPLAVIEWDADFVITLWNRRAEEMFGWCAADVVGRRIDSFSIIHEEDVDKVAAVMQRLRDPATHYLKSENRNRTRDGRTLYSEWYNSILHDEAGQVVTVFSLVLDVTERNQAMEQLREADRRKDVYIATLAHELRNPLAPIVNAAALLRSPELAPERLAWIADMVGRQAAQMAHLLDDLLDVSRIGRGKIELHKTSVDLRRLIHDALQTSMPLVEAGKHQVNLDLPAAPVWVEADPLRLSQVLANLINNAAKYTGPGGIIDIGLAAGGGTARITVADNGVGIEAAMLGRVFEPFVQASSALHLAQGGLGIGLSLAKGLVELHGGTVTVASAGNGCGSRFCVTLPLAQASDGAPEEPCGEAPAATLRKTILIADDNEDAADSLALLLRGEGAQVEVAHDGEAALRMFRDHPADIALLDLGMPRMGGLEVALALSRSTPRPFLVALTGRGRREDRAASFEAGFDEHLTKPVAAQQLIELLQRV
jgi:PAS domain S-box-containing protein